MRMKENQEEDSIKYYGDTCKKLLYHQRCKIHRLIIQEEFQYPHLYRFKKYAKSP
jgi:hypothetical protein